eukprot:112527-Rhodomonas_salina.2
MPRLSQRQTAHTASRALPAPLITYRRTKCSMSAPGHTAHSTARACRSREKKRHALASSKTQTCSVLGYLAAGHDVAGRVDEQPVETHLIHSPRAETDRAVVRVLVFAVRDQRVAGLDDCVQVRARLSAKEVLIEGGCESEKARERDGRVSEWKACMCACVYAHWRALLSLVLSGGRGVVGEEMNGWMDGWVGGWREG